ncbi:hypothetical protein ACQPYK_29340 [Streptosporangium sp. CA-135522]|uniref:hypothetical protein n=1 Tax=Streptosporangium sp. CA-135522 TaxID=3240072 RepID=UPI003D8BA296
MTVGLFIRVFIRSLKDNARHAFTAADQAAARAAITKPETRQHIRLEPLTPRSLGTCWYLCQADEHEPTGFVEHYGWARNSVAATYAARQAGQK